MSLISPTRIKRPDLSKGTFYGRVVDNDDPKKRQRLKIRIPQLHRDIPDSDLPWMMPQSIGGNHVEGGIGRVDVPPVNALLAINFEEDDPHSARYGGSPTVDNVHKDNEILNEDYPNTRGEVDESGFKTTYNKQRKEWSLQHPSGSGIFIDGSGNISLVSAAGVFISAQNDIRQTAAGAVYIHTSSFVDVKGSNIGLNDSGSASSSSPTTPRTPVPIVAPTGQTKL